MYGRNVNIGTDDTLIPSLDFFRLEEFRECSKLKAAAYDEATAGDHPLK
jgi:hypothetical protein